VTSRLRPGQPSFESAPHRVRIIGGRWKRTPLEIAAVPGLRPTPDRVRETLFNWINHLVPDIAQVNGIDLFAGSGALGFELASRGARSVVLVETNPAALSQLKAIRQRLDATQVEIIAGDAFAVAGRQPSGSFDLVFLDPPFDLGLEGASLAASRRLVAPEGWVYFESGTLLSEPQAAEFDLEVVRQGRAGRVAFHLLRPRSA
jgi:16S rRNA (guanine966-N2)-methyltransferase